MTVNGGAFGMGNGSALASNVILNGGRLHGDGPIGALIGTGGRVEPGFGLEGPGTLEPKGMTLAAGVEAHFDLYSAPGGIGHDQIRVTGAVNLGNATLQLSPRETFVPFNGRLTLIDNDGNDPVIGTFAGLPEGAHLREAAVAPFRISYTGGTGNDVVRDVARHRISPLRRRDRRLLRHRPARRQSHDRRGAVSRSAS